MTTKKELKQHIAELRELIRVRDKKISELTLDDTTANDWYRVIE